MALRDFMTYNGSVGGSILPTIPGLTDASSIPSMAQPSLVEALSSGPSSFVPQLGISNTMAGAPSAAPSIWDSFFSKTENGITNQGWGNMAIGAGSALLNGYLGFKQLGIAKDTLENNKRQFNLNFDAQRKLTNSRLADRQATRLASNPNGGYQSVGEYMKQYGI